MDSFLSNTHFFVSNKNTVIGFQSKKWKVILLCNCKAAAAAGGISSDLYCILPCDILYVVFSTNLKWANLMYIMMTHRTLSLFMIAPHRSNLVQAGANG